MEALRLTNCSNDLTFEAELIRKSRCKICDATFPIARHIRSFANMVEHVAACEKQHRNQANGGPHITALQNGKNIRRSHCEEGYDAE